MSFDSTKRDLETLVALTEMLGYKVLMANAKSEQSQHHYQHDTQHDTVMIMVTKLRSHETSDDGVTHTYNIPRGVR